MSSICRADPTNRLDTLPAGVWSTSSSVIVNQIMLHMSKVSGSLPPISVSSRSISPRQRLLLSTRTPPPCPDAAPRIPCQTTQRIPPKTTRISWMYLRMAIPSSRTSAVSRPT